jgi:hypothetical protein
MMVPLTFAVLLTLAAGLSLAEENDWSSPADTGVADKGALDGTQGAAALHGDTQIWRAHVTPARDGPAQADPDPGTKQGVGSRALTGHEVMGPEPHPAADEAPR